MADPGETEAAAESEQRFRALADATPATIWATDRIGVVRFVNRAHCTLFGTTLEEARTTGWRPVVHPDDATDYVARYDSALEERKAFRAEARVRDADGRWRWLDSQALPAFSDEGEFLGMVGSSSNVSDGKHASEAAREADRRRNHFLAVLSHELRNPLAPIRASLSILDRAPPNGEHARRAREVIERQMGLLTRLLDDLLDITRITRNKVTLQRKRFELNELVQKTVDDYRLFFVERRVLIELTPAERPLYVSGDWNRFAQIVGNLLQNAAKFTPPGGVTRVSVTGDERCGEAVIRVVDTGDGMSADTLAQLFEPFMQVEQTLERSRGGLGLGLALVKGLLDLQGGSVTATSLGPGQGSELTVRVPFDSSDTDPPPPVPNTPPPSRRVLIIEDNVNAANSMGELLELGGHEVAIAFNGVEGLAKAHDHRPDVVLCDIGLPGLDGYEVARRLREQAAFQGVLLVALSGYAQPEDVQRAVDAGFDVHLTKPANLEALEEVLRTSPERPQRSD